MSTRIRFGIAAFLLLPLVAVAGHQVCGSQPVAQNVRTCPDGGIPMFVADEIKPYPAPQPARDWQHQAERRDWRERDRAAPASPDTGAGDLNYYFRVWRTRIPGAVWTSPSGYRGHDWLHVSAGVAVGDLIIRPDGTYVWNSYGGKKGQWVRGDAEYPIVLIDTAEHRQWKVSVDPRHAGGRDIIVWDGNSFYYDGRK